MKSIGPYEILPAGTPVAMKNYRGVILSHNVAPNGVVVHKIKIMSKLVRTFGKNYKIVPTEKIIEPNYSFVYVI